MPNVYIACILVDPLPHYELRWSKAEQNNNVYVYKGATFDQAVNSGKNRYGRVNWLTDYLFIIVTYFKYINWQTILNI